MAVVQLFDDDSFTQQPSTRETNSASCLSVLRSSRRSRSDRLRFIQRSPVNQGDDSEEACSSEDESPSDEACSVSQPQSSAALRRFFRHRRTQICSRRFPRGRASLLVFVLVIAERYIFYGAVNGLFGLIPEFNNNGGGFASFLKIFLYYCIGRLFYPIGGFLADVYLGRYRVIHISLWLYWIAFALLAIAHVLHVCREASVVHNHVLPIASYVLIVLASGGFESTIIPFGADQMEAASSGDLSSYFYWLYFSFQVGILINIVVSSAISLLIPLDLRPIMPVLMTLIVITLALLLHVCLEHWYFNNVLRENCIKMVSQVSWFAATVKRHMPQYRRAFRYGEGKVPRIELAKQKYDGKFTGDQVEDVKTFCRICLVLFSLGGFFFSLSGWTTMLINRMNSTLAQAAHDSELSHIFIPNVYPILNTVSMIVFLPIVNHVLVPCIPSMTIRSKMTIGLVIAVLSLAIGALLEYTMSNKSPLHKALWFIIPSILLTLPEVFVFVSVLEFVYAQSPESMKGILTGLLYFILGIFSGGSTTAFYIFSESSANYEYFYTILLVFTTLGFIEYVLVACLYVNRQRPNMECDETDETRHVYNIVIPETGTQ